MGFGTIPSTPRAVPRLSRPMLDKKILDDANAKSFVFDRRVPRFRHNPRKGKSARGAPEFGAENERTKRNSGPPDRRSHEAMAGHRSVPDHEHPSTHVEGAEELLVFVSEAPRNCRPRRLHRSSHHPQPTP